MSFFRWVFWVFLGGFFIANPGNRKRGTTTTTVGSNSWRRRPSTTWPAVSRPAWGWSHRSNSSRNNTSRIYSYQTSQVWYQWAQCQYQCCRSGFVASVSFWASRIRILFNCQANKVWTTLSKKLYKKLIFWWHLEKATEETNRIRRQIPKSVERILGCGSEPKCHGSITLTSTCS